MSTERVIQHHQRPHRSIHSSWWKTYELPFQVFIRPGFSLYTKKHPYSADSLHETLSRCVISCNCPFRSIARRISAGKQVPEKRCPWKKKVTQIWEIREKSQSIFWKTAIKAPMKTYMWPCGHSKGGFPLISSSESRMVSCVLIF